MDDGGSCYSCFVALRHLVIRGRRSPELYSCETWQCDPREPRGSIPIGKEQHYGLVTEPPDGSLCVAIGINGSSTHLYSVAEYTVGQPKVEIGETLLWSQFGQRLLLDEDGRIGLSTPLAAGTLIMEDDTTTIEDDLVVSQDAVVGRDLTSQHDLGASSGALSVTAQGPNVTAATASGDDKSFEVQFTVPNSSTLAKSNLIATVQLGRSFGSIPRCVVSGVSDSWGTGTPVFSAQATDGQHISIYYQSATSITGDNQARRLAVFVRG